MAVLFIALAILADLLWSQAHSLSVDSIVGFSQTALYDASTKHNSTAAVGMRAPHGFTHLCFACCLARERIAHQLQHF